MLPPELERFPSGSPGYTRSIALWRLLHTEQVCTAGRVSADGPAPSVGAKSASNAQKYVFLTGRRRWHCGCSMSLRRAASALRHAALVFRWSNRLAFAACPWRRESLLTSLSCPVQTLVKPVRANDSQCRSRSRSGRDLFRTATTQAGVGGGDLNPEQKDDR
jgi:hypothetical protein